MVRKLESTNIKFLDKYYPIIFLLLMILIPFIDSIYSIPFSGLITNILIFLMAYWFFKGYINKEKDQDSNAQ